MRKVMGHFAGLAILAQLATPAALAAENRLGTAIAPSPGDHIPASVHIAGVDGESRPRPFGLVIFHGQFVALVEAKSRRIVDVTSDAPLPAASLAAR